MYVFSMIFFQLLVSKIYNCLHNTPRCLSLYYYSMVTLAPVREGEREREREKSRTHLVIVFGNDNRQGRAEHLHHDRPKIVPDANGQRDRLGEAELENDQNARVTLHIFSSPKNACAIGLQPRDKRGERGADGIRVS